MAKNTKREGSVSNQADPPLIGDWSSGNPRADVDRMIEHANATGLPADPQCSVEVSITEVQGEFCVPLPVLEATPTGHIKTSANVRLLGCPLAQQVLTRLRTELNKRAARMDNGRFVQDPSHALIWLLEQYGRALGLDKTHGRKKH